jgi:hypothetical protein
MNKLMESTIELSRLKLLIGILSALEILAISQIIKIMDFVKILRCLARYNLSLLLIAVKISRPI